ncbi:MAG: curli biogenesis system outer membrane secretion channel CsgG [Cognaticolwellia sp.]|jgi:curli biogenesis system outer membrane secretion channel CsgG
MNRRSFLFSAVAASLMAAIPGGSAWAKEPERVAVLYFENQGNPELEPLKVGLAQMLITDLTGSKGIQVVERAKLQAILDELELGHSGKVDGDTAAQVGKLLGAKWLILGSYFELMGTLRIDARLVRVETGEIVASQGVNDVANAFMGMEKKLAEGLKEALAQKVAPPHTRSETGDGAATAAVITQSTAQVIVAPDAKELAAAVSFSEGLIYLDKKDVPRAREAFESAVAANPNLDAAKTELASLEI